MPTPNNNIPILVQKLQAELERVAAENDTLKAEIDALLKKKEDAEQRAAAAEQNARQTEANLAKLRTLAQGEYKTVVAQLFREPSKEAARQTFIATVASIVIGLLATILSVQYSLRKGDDGSAALKRELAALVGSRVAESDAQTAQQLRDTETRMNQSVQSAFQNILTRPPSEAEIISLARNVVVQRTVASGRDLYFRVSLPSGVQRLDVRVWTSNGNADLFFRYGEVPAGPSPPKVCASTGSGTKMENCFAVTPVAGDWYARVRGAGNGYSTFVIQAAY